MGMGNDQGEKHEDIVPITPLEYSRLPEAMSTTSIIKLLLVVQD